MLRQEHIYVHQKNASLGSILEVKQSALTKEWGNIIAN